MTAAEEKAARREAVRERAGALALEYKAQGFHCSEATIRACADALGLHLSEDVLRAACGFRGGGGGYGDRCGVLEAGCMLVSYLYGRLTPHQEVWPYCYLIRVLHDRFLAEMESLYCRDIQGKQLNGAPATKQTCNRTFEVGARVVTGLLLEADDLLSAIPEEEKARDKFE